MYACLCVRMFACIQYVCTSVCTYVCVYVSVYVYYFHTPLCACTYLHTYSRQRHRHTPDRKTQTERQEAMDNKSPHTLSPKPIALNPTPESRTHPRVCTDSPHSQCPCICRISEDKMASKAGFGFKGSLSEPLFGFA